MAIPAGLAPIVQAPSSVWLGPAGALVNLPEQPDISVPKAKDRRTSTADLLAGGRRGARSRYGVRSYVMTWTALPDASFAILEALAEGAYGPPPYWLLEPTQGNLLDPNPSSGTDVLRDLTGLDADGVTLASYIGRAERGLRSVQVTVPPVAGTGLDASRVPCVPGQAYSMRAAAGVDIGMQAWGRLTWQDLSGTTFGAVSGTGVELPAAGLAELTATGTAPAGAVWVTAGVGFDATGGTAYVDGLSLRQGTGGAWQIGRGVPTVQITGPTDTVEVVGYHDCALTLDELL